MLGCVVQNTRVRSFADFVVYTRRGIELYVTDFRHIISARRLRMSVAKTFVAWLSLDAFSPRNFLPVTRAHRNYINEKSNIEIQYSEKIKCMRAARR